mgnify:CR=1 FL=1
MARRYNLEKLEPNPISDLFGELKKQNEENLIENYKDKVVELNIDLLQPYSKHHFSHPQGEEWDEFVSGIKSYGVLQPIIVRKANGMYEILAGHSRTEAAKEAGFETVPAIITDADDIDASVLVGLTNKQREHISDIEWGWTYRETYELLKRSAGRPKNDAGADDEKNSCHRGTNFSGDRTDEILAEKYGVGARTIQRKMRLTYLSPEMVDMYEKKKIKQAIAIELSYLPEDTQKAIAALMEIEKVALTEDVAKTIREASEEKELTVDEIHKIFIAGSSAGAAQEEQVNDIKAKVPEAYIPDGLKKKEKEEYIIKAVKYVWENGIKL